MAKFYLILLLSLLSGCSSTTYKEISRSDPHAIIMGTKNGSIYDYRGAQIRQVNGLALNNFSQSYTDPRNIKPGKTELFVFAIIPPDIRAWTAISFTAEARKKYRLDFDDLGESVRFYIIETNSGEIVSERIANKTVAEPTKQVFVPIIVH